jgi:transposase InsO family protein
MPALNKHPINVPSDIGISSRISIDGREWECTNASTGLENKVRLREVDGSNTIALTRPYIQELWEEERAVITRHVKQAQTRALELHNLNPTERRNFDRQCAGVTFMLETEHKKKAYAEFVDFCEKQNQYCLEENRVKPKPAQKCKTVGKWVREYRKAGNFMCFIKKDHRTHYRPKQFDDEIEALVEEAIYLNYSTDLRPKMTKAFRALVSMTKAKYDLTEKEAKGILPSYRTFVRRIEKSDHYQVLEKRHGKLFLRNAAGYGKKTGYPPFIGGRVEVDCNRVDVMVYDEHLDRCYRPWLMTMIDVYTRCIIAWDLSVTAPSAAKVARVLKRAICADDHPFRCIPHNILVDNGSEFINKTLRDQCSALNIRILFAPPRTGKAKPFVERGFRTLNEIFFHQVPGTTFSNTQHRGDYDSEANVIYTLDKLNEHFVLCLKVYHSQYHRGIENTPMAAWKDATSVPEHSVETLPEEDAKYFGMKTVDVSISGSKVRYNNLVWTSPALPELAFSLAEGKGNQLRSEKASKVNLRYDENDLTYAYVCDHRAPSNIIQCDPDSEAYQTGLTMDVHEYLMKDKVARQKILQNDSEGFRIRAEFEQLLEDYALTAGKKTNRKRAQLRQSAQQSRKAREAASGYVEEDNSLDSTFIESMHEIFNPEDDSEDAY